MSTEPLEHNIKDLVAKAPIDEACRMVISELRMGILKARDAILILKRELYNDEKWKLDDEQLQIITIAEMGATEAVKAIDELLVDGLLRRLESLESNNFGSD